MRTCDRRVHPYLNHNTLLIHQPTLLVACRRENVRPVVRSACHLVRAHKYTGAVVFASENQHVEWLIRDTVDLVCAWGESLPTDHKLEGQGHNNLGRGSALAATRSPRSKVTATRILAYLLINSPLNV